MSNLLQRLRCGECGEPEPDVTRCLRCVAADALESQSCEGRDLRGYLREIRDHHADEHFEAWARAFAKDALNLVSEEPAQDDGEGQAAALSEIDR
ncbi:hypothetical protein LCGC14_2740430 [marine sediment metagenome]|uniref:Uncharacterized protein n=1 Tax=marine sediment metagenome TaxID=412755 RepID=A0A0F9BDG7_9ZZZZ